jgi:chaperonin GroES
MSTNVGICHRIRKLTFCHDNLLGTGIDASWTGKYFKNEIIMIRPLGTRVVIEPKEAETMTAGGLYIPDNAKEKPQQGTVVAVGPGAKDEPMEVKVGETVLYGKYAGTEVTVDNKKYLIVKQSDILAIL